MDGASWLNLILVAGTILWGIELVLLWRGAVQAGDDPIARVSGAAIFYVLALPVAAFAPDVVERLADVWERVASLGGASGRDSATPRLVIGGKTFPLTSEQVRIGRFGNNDLVIDHPTVSAYHAEISLRPDGRHELTDRESRNGTRINGTPIRSAVLRDGDLITIGAVSLHYLIRPPAEGSLGSIPQPSRNRLG
ncbi:FHA domain-containing protein [Sphaerobacter thermophilus]|uniref:FHA domain-containing protein n=1 Tax=Sphaerobacter thermophilus TaxID=2057 RepID=UPI0039C1550E